MEEPEGHRRLLALLLLLAALRTALLRFQPAPAELQSPETGPPTLLPDLAHDDWVRLSWLPEVGPEKARRIVAGRAYLGVPLTPERLHLIPGCGSTLEQRVQAWYGQWPAPAAPDGS